MLIENIFDREREVASIRDFLQRPDERLLLVVGESGCGKSILIEKALRVACSNGSLLPKSTLHYSFRDAREAQRFPAFLMDEFLKLRPLRFLEKFLVAQGAKADSLALRLPFASFQFRPPDLKDHYNSAVFLGKLAYALGRHYQVLYIQNVEGFGASENLELIEALAKQPSAPKVIAEIGTLMNAADYARRHLMQHSQARLLEVSLFSDQDSERCFRFIHGSSPPSSIFEISRGNAMAIRHHGTALAELPVADQVRASLDGFAPEAMKIIWCLASFSGRAEVDALRAVTALGPGFDTALIELRQAHVIRLDEETYVTFAHSLLLRYFLSDSFAHDLAVFGRRRIISWLNERPLRSAPDLRELAKQHLALSEYEAAWHHAMEAALTCYQQQDFRTVIELADVLDQCQNIPPAWRSKANLLLFQTGIRTGDAQMVLSRFPSILESNDGVSALLQAQALYLMNRFREAAGVCDRLSALANDSFVASRALGIRASCFIALDRHADAANDFAAAEMIAERNGDRELLLELLRLSPELESKEVWTLRFQKLQQSILPDLFPYFYAKCLHNFGTELLLESAGEDGWDEVNAAAAVFESGRYPEYSYVGTTIAAAMLLRGKAEEAGALLEDILPWCHEQYDGFAVHNNLGVAAGLSGDWTTALVRFRKAAEVATHPTFCLSDPHFIHQSKHNLAVALGALGQVSAAVEMLESATFPVNCHDLNFKVERRDRLRKVFREKGPIPATVEFSSPVQRWNNRGFILEVTTLQFFDFNANVLPPDSMTTL